MTNEERAAEIQRIGEQFVEYSKHTLEGFTNEKITIVMLGTISGAIAVMLAIGVPFTNIANSINAMLKDMTS
jgi:hypothetical protein